MELSINAPTLAAAVQPVTRALGRGDAAGSLLLRVDGGELVVSAHDGELGIERRVVVDSSDPGQARVDGKLFFDFLKSLPDTDVVLSTQQTQLRIAAGEISVELRTVIVDHPASIVPPSTESVVIDAEAFVSVTNDVERAASRDESRPMLTGISVTADDDALTMVATDSYRLNVSRAQMIGGEWNALVPVRTMNEMVRLIGLTKTTNVTLERAANGLRASVGGFIVNSRLVDGQFPNYKALIPPSFTQEVEIETEPFLESLTRMNVLAGRGTPVRLHFTTGHVTIGVEGGDIGRGGETLECEWNGDEMTIGYNPQYLREALELTGEKAILKIVDEIKPSLILRPDDPDSVKLLMPIRLSV